MLQGLPNRRERAGEHDEAQWPPGQVLTRRLPVLHYGPTPSYTCIPHFSKRVKLG